MFAAGLWGTIVRPASYEVNGEVVARPSATLLLVRHEGINALGMQPMDLMPVFGEPAQLDAAAVRAGDRVRLAVRQRDDQLVLVRIEKRP